MSLFVSVCKCAIRILTNANTIIVSKFPKTIGWFGIFTSMNLQLMTILRGWSQFSMCITFVWKDFSRFHFWDVNVCFMTGESGYWLIWIHMFEIKYEFIHWRMNSNMINSWYSCRLPCEHVLRITDKLRHDMIHIQNWKIYASHYNDDTSELGLEWKKAQHDYKMYGKKWEYLLQK